MSNNENELLSPITGYRCKRITSQNVKQFGFNSIAELKSLLPDQPLVCEQSRLSYNNSISKASKASMNARVTQDRYCLSCNSMLTSKYQKKYCSKSCSVRQNNQTRDNTGQRESINASFAGKYSRNPKLCSECHEPISYTNRRKKYCDNHSGQGRRPVEKKLPCRFCKCGAQITEKAKRYCGKCKTNIRHYRFLCEFKFNVFDFPNDFNIDLIKEHGWYSPNGFKGRNKNPNLAGVSRDHLFNVADGFKENRDPAMLSHPANCRVMIHNGVGGNNSKKRSSISWEELLKRIDEWDKTH